MRSTPRPRPARCLPVAVVADEHMFIVEQLQAVYAGLVRHLGLRGRDCGCLPVAIARSGPAIAAVDEIQVRLQFGWNRHVPGTQKWAAWIAVSCDLKSEKVRMPLE